MPAKNNSQRLLAVIAAGVLLVAAILLYRQTAPRSPGIAGREYYLDLAKGELFPDNAGKNPPFPSPSGGGGEAVLAFVYACNSCADPYDRKIAWVQKRTPEALELIGRGDIKMLPPPQANIVENGWLVATYENGKVGPWLSLISPDGQAIATAWHQACGGKPQTCAP